MKDLSFSGSKFQDINEGHLAGEVSKKTKEVTIYGKQYLTSLITVPRFSGNVDVLPLLFTEKTYKLYQQAVDKSKVALLGRLRGFFYCDAHDYAAVTKFFMPEELDNYSQKYEQRNNSMHIAGRLVAMPKERRMDRALAGEKVNRSITYFRLAVNVPEANNHFLCYVRQHYAQALADVKPGDWIDIYGRYQSRDLLKPVDREITNSVDNVPRAFQVAVAKINEIRYADSGVSVVPKPTERV